MQLNPFCPRMTIHPTQSQGNSDPGLASKPTRWLHANPRLRPKCSPSPAANQRHAAHDQQENRRRLGHVPSHAGRYVVWTPRLHVIGQCIPDVQRPQAWWFFAPKGIDGTAVSSKKGSAPKRQAPFQDTSSTLCYRFNRLCACFQHFSCCCQRFFSTLYSLLLCFSAKPKSRGDRRWQ